MDTIQLLRVFKTDDRTRPYVGGVFPADGLPTVKTYPRVFIANTEIKGLPGQHWVAMYFSKAGVGEFFDSYGEDPRVYGPHFNKFLTDNGEQWKHNKICLQSFDTAVCGQYCLFYCLHRCRNISMEKIVSTFSSDKLMNDLAVHDYIETLYDVRVPISAQEFICNQICIPKQKVIF